MESAVPATSDAWLELPADQEVRHRRGDDEGAREGGEAEAERSREPTAHVGRIDLHAGEERQDDRSELRHEVKPFGAAEIEDVPDDDAECQLDQRHRHAELDGHHRGDDDYGGEDCSELDWLHGSTSGS